MQFNSGTYILGERDLTAWFCPWRGAGRLPPAASILAPAALSPGPVHPRNTLFVAFEQFTHCNYHRSWES